MSATRVIIFFTFVSSALAVYLLSGEDYYLNIKSISVISINKTHFGEGTYLRINKTAKYKSFMASCMDYKSETGPLSAFMLLWVQDSSQQWKVYAVNQMNFGPVCKSPIIKPFFAMYKDSVFDSNCVFPIQKTCFEGVDMDEELHKGMKSAENGCFKIHLKYRIPGIGGPLDILVYELIVKTEKRTKDHDNNNNNNNKKGKKGRPKSS